MSRVVFLLLVAVALVAGPARADEPSPAGGPHLRLLDSRGEVIWELGGPRPVDRELGSGTLRFTDADGERVTLDEALRILDSPRLEAVVEDWDRQQKAALAGGAGLLTGGLVSLGFAGHLLTTRQTCAGCFDTRFGDGLGLSALGFGLTSLGATLLTVTLGDERRARDGELVAGLGRIDVLDALYPDPPPPPEGGGERVLDDKLGPEECFSGLRAGRLQRLKRRGVQVLAVAPEDQALPITGFGVELKELLAHDSRELDICRPVLASLIHRHEPVYVISQINLGIYLALAATSASFVADGNSGYTGLIAAGSGSMLFAALATAGLPSRSWLGIRDALRAHVEGESLSRALRAGLRRRMGEGLGIGGGVLALGAVAAVLPYVVRDREVTPLVAFWAPQLTLGVTLGVMGLVVATSPLPEGLTIAVRAPPAQPFAWAGPGGVGFGLRW